MGAGRSVRQYPTRDAATLIDKLAKAGTANDAAGVAAIVRSDAVMRVAPVSLRGNYATTFLSFTQPASGLDNARLVVAARLKDSKIFRLWVFALGVTPPFENAAVP